MLLTRAANLLYDSALTLLYPQSCAVCGEIVSTRADGVACRNCWAQVRFFKPGDILCWKCGMPTGTTVSLSETQRLEVRCRECEVQDFDAARACGVYEGALRAAVLSLKRVPDFSKRLSELLYEWQRQPPLNSATMIVPVPLHPQREQQRGFNQAAVIGVHLSRSCEVPVSETNLVRVVHSERHRAGMDAAARRVSVDDVFQVRYPRLISGEHVLLVDDVFTTGATVSACARVLREAGAAEVLALTLVRPSPY